MLRSGKFGQQLLGSGGVCPHQVCGNASHLRAGGSGNGIRVRLEPRQAKQAVMVQRPVCGRDAQQNLIAVECASHGEPPLQ